MKRLLIILVSVLLVVSMTGCSLFSSGDKDASDMPDLKITDDIVHSAPEGAAARYSYTTAHDEENVEYYKSNYGIDFIEDINIIYGDKDNNPLAMYEYMVLKTEDDCKTFVTEYEKDGIDCPFEINGNVLVLISDKEDFMSLIEANQMYATFEATASGFAEFWKETFFFIEFNGN